MKFLKFKSKKNQNGNLDIINEGILYGWAYDSDLSESSNPHCEVIIYANGTEIGRAIANQYRDDLKNALEGNGDCAFAFELPVSCLVGGKSILTARFEPNGAPIGGKEIEFLGTSALSERKSQESDWFAYPGFPDWNSKVSGDVGSETGICPGWILRSTTKEAENKLTYSLSSLDVPQGLSLTSSLPSVHINSNTQNIVDTQLIGKIRKIKTYTSMPLELTFYSNKLNKENFQFSEVSLKYYDGNELLTLATLAKNIFPCEGVKAHRLVIQSELIVNGYRTLDIDALYLTIEFSGVADIMVSDFSIKTVDASQSFHLKNSDSFEDSRITDQLSVTKGFFEFDTIKSRGPILQPWQGSSNMPLVEIIIPVFNAKEYVLNCIQSVIDHTHIPYLLTVIDDGSSQDTIDAVQDILSPHPWMRMIKHTVNKGYTIAINTALKQLRGQAAVLLNSDTVVPDNWLDRLIACANSSENIAIVGPMSNAASWQSLPEMEDDNGWAVNELPQGLTVNDFDNMVNNASIKAYPRVPVVNGFCFYIKAKVFDKVGYFDEISFPKGYGEENDFCIRTSDAGYELAICDDTYIFHHKSKTFGNAQRKELTTASNSLLAAKHGDKLSKLSQGMKKAVELNQLREKIKVELEKI